MKQARKGRLTALAMAGLFTAAAAGPAEAASVGLRDDGPDHLRLGGGFFDVRDDDRVAAFSPEYRLGKKVAYLSPAVGALVNADGGFYGYAGIHLDIGWGPVSITPGFAAGYYSRGDSKDLGGPFAFRQSIELSYRLDGGIRLGALIAHISNASIYDDNPGQEDAQITLAIPLPPLFD